jgi:cytochrome c
MGVAERRIQAIMKTCALCHGKLGLGIRFRNIWNGRWWAHVRLVGSLRKHL